MGPLFRWAGSKHRVAAQVLLPVVEALGDRVAPRWVCPFAGGISVELEAIRAGLATSYVLADVLPEVAATLGVLASDEAGELLRRLRERPRSADLDEEWGRYLLLREQRPEDPVDIAERFLTLQATSFNGLWRVNGRGEHNVSFGKKMPAFDFEALEGASQALGGADVNILCQDFEQTVALAGPGDVVYADPPYLGTHSDYAEDGFTLADHRRLAEALRGAAERGAACWVSGSDCERTREVYGGEVLPIYARRSMAGRGDRRGVVQEVLIRIRARFDSVALSSI